MGLLTLLDSRAHRFKMGFARVADSLRDAVDHATTSASVMLEAHLCETPSVTSESGTVGLTQTGQNVVIGDEHA